MSYELQTDVFQGPFGLLLELIEKIKVFINDVSLTQITDEYLELVQNIEHTDIDDMSTFVTICSTLILIKSKSLFPKIELSKKEELDIESLKKRLYQYKIFKKATNILKEHLQKDIKTSTGSVYTEEQIVFSPHSTLCSENITLALRAIIERFPKELKKKKYVVLKKVIHLEDMMSDLHQRILKSKSFSFSSFKNQKSGEQHDKEIQHNQVGSFLALLAREREERQGGGEGKGVV